MVLVHPITLHILPPISKCFLCSLHQINTWDKFISSESNYIFFNGTYKHFQNETMVEEKAESRKLQRQETDSLASMCHREATMRCGPSVNLCERRGLSQADHCGKQLQPKRRWCHVMRKLMKLNAELESADRADISQRLRGCSVSTSNPTPIFLLWPCLLHIFLNITLFYLRALCIDGLSTYGNYLKLPSSLQTSAS